MGHTRPVAHGSARGLKLQAQLTWRVPLWTGHGKKVPVTWLLSQLEAPKPTTGHAGGECPVSQLGRGKLPSLTFCTFPGPRWPSALHVQACQVGGGISFWTLSAVTSSPTAQGKVWDWDRVGSLSDGTGDPVGLRNGWMGAVTALS